MRKLVVALGLTLLLSGGAWAQFETPFDFYVGGGATVPAGPDFFTDNTNTGWNALLEVGYSFPNVQGLQALAKGQFNRLDQDDIAGTPIDASLNLWQVGADVRYNFGSVVSPTRPYIGAGAGAAIFDYGDLDGDPADVAAIDENETEFYFEFTGGLGFNVGENIDLFVQGSYVGIDTPGELTSLVPITAGIRF